MTIFDGPPCFTLHENERREMNNVFEIVAVYAFVCACVYVIIPFPFDLLFLT